MLGLLLKNNFRHHQLRGLENIRKEEDSELLKRKREGEEEREGKLIPSTPSNHHHQFLHILLYLPIEIHGVQKSLEYKKLGSKSSTEFWVKQCW